MEISDIRVRLVKETNERLKAVCSITFDSEFVVRDVKVVDGNNGLFVAMPSRKLSVPCPKCRAQNYVRAKFCNECGARLPTARIPVDNQGREKAHRDIAHPITPNFRQAMQERVLEAYRSEGEQAPPPQEVGSEVDAEFDEPAGPEDVSDYDALIADLKGSTGRATSRPEPARQEQQAGRREGPRWRRRGRGEDRGGAGQGAPKEPQRAVSESRPQYPAGQPVDDYEVADDRAFVREDAGSDRGRDALEQRAEDEQLARGPGVREQRSVQQGRSEQAASPPPRPAPVDADETAFGEGIF